MAVLITVFIALCSPCGAAAAEAPLTRTRSQVNAMIRKAGQSPPVWWDSVKLQYPKTLDLRGYVKLKKGLWKPKIKLGAYMISIISPNPSKWRGSIKLWHHVLTVRKNDPQKLREAMRRLAGTYFNYEHDYARAAFWWRKAPVRYAGTAVRLAKCYWKLGNKPMALQLLRRMRSDQMGNAGLIRLYDEMGDRRKAISLMQAKTRTRHADAAWLAGGDIWRKAGEYQKALNCYRRVLAMRKRQRVKGKGHGKHLKYSRQRARQAIEATRLFARIKISELQDGTYKASSRGFRGPVEVTVKVAGGKITSVEVTKTKEDIAFTSQTDVPRQIVDKQGLAGVDSVTGATVTSRAVINAAAKAMSKGAR